jgi:hypothetical protein
MAELARAPPFFNSLSGRTKANTEESEMFWLGAVVSLCYVPGITGAYIDTQWPVLAVLLPFGLLRSGPFTVFHVMGMAFIAYAFMRLPFSPAPYASVFGLWLIVIMGMSMWFGTIITNMRGLYAGLAVGGAASSFAAVLQYLGWNVVVSVTDARFHAAGLYVNSVQQGTVLALIAVALASEGMWAWAFPLMPGIWLAHSRGAGVALAAGVLGCYVRPLWVFGVIGVAVAFYLFTPASFSDGMRASIWGFALASLKWLGWGPGIFYTVALPQDGAFAFYPEYAHNDALQLLWEYGVGALLPISIFGYALWRTDVKEWPTVLAFVVAGCYSMPLFMPIASFLGLVAVGRIFRVHGLARGDCDSRRQYVVQGEWDYYVQASRQDFSLASHHTAKG